MSTVKTSEDGVEIKTYKIEFWETEEDREYGLGNIYLLEEDVEVSKEKSIEVAEDLFNNQNFASVEVLDEDGSVLFFISNDTPEGESYE